MRRMIPTKKINILDRMSIQSDGNVNVSGELTADEIIENMSGFSFTKTTDTANTETTPIYAGVVKTGNKITFVYFSEVKVINAASGAVGHFTIPSYIGDKLFPTSIGGDTNKLMYGQVWFASSYNAGSNGIFWVDKTSSTQVTIALRTTGISAGTYNVRLEMTFLLSENLAS